MTVSGRKHSVRLCSPRQAEAERWGVALREVIASKAPLETPTQLLLRDIQVRGRELHGQRGGWWTHKLSGFMVSPLLHHFDRSHRGLQTTMLQNPFFFYWHGKEKLLFRT